MLYYRIACPMIELLFFSSLGFEWTHLTRYVKTAEFSQAESILFLSAASLMAWVVFS